MFLQQQLRFKLLHYIQGSSRSQATMEALKEMYAKVEKLDKELEEAFGKVQLCRTCRERMETKFLNQNKLMQQREYWLERIDQHKMLTNRKAEEEAERKAEEEAAFAAARTPAEEAERKAKKAKEEAEDAAKEAPEC